MLPLLFLEFMEDMQDLGDTLPTLLELYISQSVRLMLKLNLDTFMVDTEFITLVPL